MNYHPEHELLEQYAAGTLPLAFSLCVSVHLNFCAHCRAEVNALQDMAGLLLADLAPVAVDDSLLQTVLAKIETASAANTVMQENASTVVQKIPKPLRTLVPDGYDALSWSTMLPGLRVVTLDVGDDEHHVTLHRLRPGGKVPRHDHRGTEITMVLNGSFSDEYGVYGDGDFIVREPAQIHRPLVAQNEECICLAAQAAPVRFTQHIWRLLNPLLG